MKSLFENDKWGENFNVEGFEFLSESEMLGVRGGTKPPTRPGDVYDFDEE